jgi:hypothetical protein
MRAGRGYSPDFLIFLRPDFETQNSGQSAAGDRE